MRTPQTYKEWEDALSRGRGGKKKVRRDVVLAARPDGVLTFHYTGYKNRELMLMATLDQSNMYTFHLPDNRYCPTYSNIYHLIGQLNTYSDMSHYKHYRQPVRVHISGRRWGNKDLRTMPFTDGLQYRGGICLNPEIAVDYKRTLNREKSLPWLRKTVVLAKVLRVAVRMGIMERNKAEACGFDKVNIEEPMARDAEIILRMGNAMGLYGWRSRNQSPEEYQAALMRAAENGLADYREWLYKKHGCYEMLPVETKGEAQ